MGSKMHAKQELFPDFSLRVELLGVKKEPIKLWYEIYDINDLHMRMMFRTYRNVGGGGNGNGGSGYREVWDVYGIIVALGSAGAFTALYHALGKFLKRNKDKTLVLMRGNQKAIIKGHSRRDENELVSKLFPYGFEQPKGKARRRMTKQKRQKVR